VREQTASQEPFAPREGISSDRFRRFVDSNVVAIGYGVGDRIVDGNRAFLEVFRARRADLPGGIALSRLQEPGNAVAFASSTSGEYQVRRLDGTTGFLIVARVDLDPEPGWLAIAVDITEHKTAERAARQLALYDPLTGLANRRLLLERLSHALSRAPRRGTHVGILFCDLDGFKELNDTYGHATGDRVLETVGRRLAELSRESDTVARNGGDEFVLVLEDLDEERQATQIAYRVRATLAQPMPLADGDVRVHCSVGVLVARPGVHLDAGRLLEQADAAMYQAKRAGGNQAVTVIAAANEDHHTRLTGRARSAQADLRASDAELCLLELQPSVESVKVARHALDRWAGEVDARAIAIAKLLVSELATNAVTHARTPYTVSARWRAPYLRVEVIDSAPLPPHTESRAAQVGGWGFEFLDRLSHTWGIDNRGDTKAIWFDIRVPCNNAEPMPRHGAFGSVGGAAANPSASVQ
jgi:diguanylate cyclase (GGDEF)-like protein